MSSAAAPVRPRRRAANLSIDENVLAAAKEFGVNASKAAEEGLRVAIRKAREEQWLNENAGAIEAHNRWVEENGLPLKPLWLDD